jgi:hypothetical protein
MGRKFAKVEEFGRALWRILKQPWAWIPLLALTAIGTGFSMGVWNNLCTNCPSIAQIHTWTPEETSKVIAHDGRIFAEIGTERRTAVAGRGRCATNGERPGVPDPDRASGGCGAAR